MDLVETNGIISIEWFILFYLMELNRVVEHICAHFSLGRNAYGRLPKLSKPVDEIYYSLPSLALLSSAHRVKLSAFLRAVFSVLCECCIPNKLLTIAPGVVNFGLL